MGVKLRDDIQKTVNQVNLRKGIAKRFISATKEKSKYIASLGSIDENKTDGMENILERLTSQIMRQEPISDDILVACWIYENNRTKHLNENRVWKVLKEQMTHILRVARTDKLKWQWYSIYLKDSIV